MPAPSRKHWTRARALIALGVLAAACAPAGGSGSETGAGAEPPPGAAGTPDGERPDVVLIVLDTLRPDHLGCYGYERETSPVIDAFAAGAVVFERAETASPWTAPALISLMTSLHPDVHGVQDFPSPGRMHERVTTLAERLRAAGYATAAFTEGGYAKAEFGLGQGFEVFPEQPGDEESNDSNMRHPSRLEDNLDRALAWYREQAGHPRFLFFHTYEVHEPLRAPDEFVRLFRPDWDGPAEEARLVAAFDHFRAEGSMTPEQVQLVFDHTHHCLGSGEPEIPDGLQTWLHRSGLIPEGKGLNQATLDFFRDHYDAELRYTDDRLARLFEALGDGAVVVLVSDHGEAIGEHGVVGHGSRFHREQVGIALIVRAPGIGPGRVGAPVASVDVKPTILELVGLDRGDTPLQGRSLVPLLRGAELDPRPTFTQSLGKHGEERSRRSVRSGDLRAIVDTLTGEVELYDLAADPGETRDLAAQRPDQARALAALVAEQLERDRQLAMVASGEVEPSELDQATLNRLRELGYLGDDDPRQE